MFVPLRDVNPTRRVPFVNYGLIVANIVAFVYLILQPNADSPELFMSLGLVPERFVADPFNFVLTIFSSMFLHGGLGHLGSNMLSLYIFGDNVEDALGHFRYVLFYLICGISAAFAQVIIDPSSQVPMVGASGAIAGVIGGYLVLYPRAPIIAFNMVLPLWFFIGVFPVVPAWLVAGEFFLVNLLQGLGSLTIPASGGIAFFAHLGGFVGGLLLVRPWVSQRRTNRRDWDGWQSEGRRFRR
jgi:membrane associated rhomboid family serine protease